MLLLNRLKSIEKAASFDLLLFKGTLRSKVLVKLSIVLFSELQVLVIGRLKLVFSVLYLTLELIMIVLGISLQIVKLVLKLSSNQSVALFLILSVFERLRQLHLEAFHEST